MYGFCDVPTSLAVKRETAVGLLYGSAEYGKQM